MKYKGQEKLEVEVTVHTGAIAINSFYKQARKNITFYASNKLQKFDIDFTKDAEQHGKAINDAQKKDPYYIQMHKQK